MKVGLVIVGILAGLIFTAFGSLLMAAPLSDLEINLAYIGRILRFTAMQASLSTFLSLCLGALLALTLNRRSLPGKPVILAGLGMATTLPGIVLVFAIATVFGRSGFFNAMLTFLNLPTFSIYGLKGILIAHVFFNTALAARVFLTSLEAIPGEHWRLASSFAMPPLAVARWIDWPILRREAPSLALLIFIVCAVSFAVPLALGGGPAAATLEVAIFEALRFDADFGRAAMLALIQIGLMASLLTATSPLLKRKPEVVVSGRKVERPDRSSAVLFLIDVAVLAISALLILPPLMAMVWSGRNLPIIVNADILAALGTSFGIAIPAACLSLIMAIAIARASAVFSETGSKRGAVFMDLLPLGIVAVPPLAFASGLFILAREVSDPSTIALPAVVLVNAMMALPFVHRFVQPPLMLASDRYARLAASLGMGSLARLRLVEAPLLTAQAAAGFAYATALSLGDLGVVSLFGSSALTTLPTLLYQRLGTYRLAEAEGIAMLLALLALALFIGAERLVGHARRF